ncbi:diaminopimelate epimerase [Pelomyxa schiedti]|nr:diaminopimelate epimerase [Pelomyxa schiedti]
MGNPHAVAIVGDIDQFPVAVVGPLIENNPLFPNRVNVEFTSAIPTPKGHIPIIRQRTWERGSGITQACGTGACATVVAWILDGLLPEREAIVRLDGGDLHIHWPTPDSEVFMEGDAVKVFEGTARL